MAVWKYYNHAMIPNCAPHDTVDASELESKEFWKKNKSALFARWTSDFDCGYETNWWYIVKDGPFDFEALDPKARKHIRQSMKKVYVKLIDMDSYAEALCEVHNNACKGYSTFTGSLTTPDSFRNKGEALDCWGIFSLENDRLVGYMTCLNGNGYAETITAKYDPAYLNLRGSDAVHYAVLEHYLNVKGYPYVCSGSRTVNHETNVQDYKISTFGFRKAYCSLNMKYNPNIRFAITIIYPLRKLLKKLNGISIVHSINAVMKMEELRRENVKLRKVQKVKETDGHE